MEVRSKSYVKWLHVSIKVHEFRLEQSFTILKECLIFADLYSLNFIWY